MTTSKFFFIQMADPQFGLFSHLSGKNDLEIKKLKKREIFIKKIPKIYNLDNEIKLLRSSIKIVNKLDPKFVIICGDMINNLDNQDQISTFKREISKINNTIKVYFVPGNHDIAYDFKQPTIQSIKEYKNIFGEDYYSFDLGSIKFISINSTIFKSKKIIKNHANDQLDFIKKESNLAKKYNKKIIIFSHHPLFINDIDEEDNEWSINKDFRKKIIELSRPKGLLANFAGHMHRNNIVFDKDLEIITSGPVGLYHGPYNEGVSGIRRVEINNTTITHSYIEI
ncbi:MAG: metallophosphoesterase [Dehalococcoidia bacterium]